MAEFHQKAVDGAREGNTEKFKAELFLEMFINFYIIRVQQFRKNLFIIKSKGDIDDLFINRDV